MYSKYEWVFTKNGIEIRKTIEDPLLGTDVRKRMVSYEEIDKIISKGKPLIKSIEPIVDGNVLKALKFEILMQLDSRESQLTEMSSKNVEKDEIVSGDTVEKTIIKVLGEFGGRASRDNVLRGVREIIKEFESPYYQQVEPNGNHIRWKHRVDSARMRLVSRGFIKKSSESGRGFWELTEKGWEFYEHIKV